MVNYSRFDLDFNKWHIFHFEYQSMKFSYK